MYILRDALQIMRSELQMVYGVIRTGRWEPKAYKGFGI